MLRGPMQIKRHISADYGSELNYSHLKLLNGVLSLSLSLFITRPSVNHSRNVFPPFCLHQQPWLCVNPASLIFVCAD